MVAVESPATHLPRTDVSSARLLIALIVAERGHPVQAAVEDAEDVDHDLIGRLVEPLGHEVRSEFGATET